jgi:ribose transport system substrate-binding protein
MRTRTWLRLLVLGIVAVAALVVLAGCGGDDDSDDAAAPAETAPAETQAATAEEVSIGVFLAASANTYNEAHVPGIEEAVEELGPATIQVFDGGFDSTKQRNQLQDALVSKKFDVWLIDPADGNAITPEVTEAVAAGIKVACMLTPCGPDPKSSEVQIPGMTAYVGQSFPENGKTIAQEVARACEDKDPCKVFYIPGLNILPLEKARTDGFTAELKKHANIELAAMQEGEYLAEPARAVTQNVLQANKDINVIASSGDQMIVGAEQAVKDAGLEDQILLVGNGASELAVEAVKAGRWFSTAIYLPKTEGKLAAEMAIKAARGEDIADVSVNVLEHSPAGIGDYQAEWKG